MRWSVLLPLDMFSLSALSWYAAFALLGERISSRALSNGIKNKYEKELKQGFLCWSFWKIFRIELLWVGVSLCLPVGECSEAISRRPRNQPQTQSWRILSTGGIMENHSINVSLGFYGKTSPSGFYGLLWISKWVILNLSVPKGHEGGSQEALKGLQQEERKKTNKCTSSVKYGG